MPSISVRRLFSDNQHKLELAWAAGNSGADNRIGVEADKPVLALVGHLNFIHPNQIQVVGVAEAEYLRRLETGELNYDFGELFDIPMSLVIVANGLPVSPKLRDYCHTNSIPLLTSKQESPHLMDVFADLSATYIGYFHHQAWRIFWMYLKWAYSLPDNPAWVRANWHWS